MDLPRNPRTAGQSAEVFEQTHRALALAAITLERYATALSMDMHHALMTERRASPGASRIATDETTTAIRAMAQLLDQASVLSDCVACRLAQLPRHHRWQGGDR